MSLPLARAANSKSSNLPMPTLAVEKHASITRSTQFYNAFKKPMQKKSKLWKVSTDLTAVEMAERIKCLPPKHDD